MEAALPYIIAGVVAAWAWSVTDKLQRISEHLYRLLKIKEKELEDRR